MQTCEVEFFHSTNKYRAGIRWQFVTHAVVKFGQIEIAVRIGDGHHTRPTLSAGDFNSVRRGIFQFEHVGNCGLHFGS